MCQRYIKGKIDRSILAIAKQMANLVFGTISMSSGLAQVQNLLKKVVNFEIETICPLHGPVLEENLGFYLNLYNTWSSYKSETDGVAIFYTSVYGHTKEAAELLA